MDAHEIATKAQNPLILLTFSYRHLLRRYNTKRTQTIWSVFFFATVCFVPPRPTEEGVGDQEKTIKYRFFAAKEPKQGAEGASVSSATRRLCDASGPFKSHRPPAVLCILNRCQPQKASCHKASGLFLPIFIVRF